jgi:hypothetical protein
VTKQTTSETRNPPARHRTRKPSAPTVCAEHSTDSGSWAAGASVVNPLTLPFEIDASDGLARLQKAGIDLAWRRWMPFSG